MEAPLRRAAPPLLNRCFESTYRTTKKNWTSIHTPKWCTLNKAASQGTHGKCGIETLGETSGVAELSTCFNCGGQNWSSVGEGWKLLMTYDWAHLFIKWDWAIMQLTEAELCCLHLMQPAELGFMKWWVFNLCIPPTGSLVCFIGPGGSRIMRKSAQCCTRCGTHVRTSGNLTST